MSQGGVILQGGGSIEVRRVGFVIRRKFRLMARYLLVLAAVVGYALRADGLPTHLERDGIAAGVALADIADEQSSVGYREVRGRVLQASEERLIAWFYGEVPKTGGDAWLALVWSVEQCRPLRILIVWGTGDATPTPDLPTTAELRSHPAGLRGFLQARWRAPSGLGGQGLELDTEAVEETVREIYELQPELIELWLSGENSDPLDARAVFLVDDFRKSVEYLRWRCIDKSGWVGD